MAIVLNPELIVYPLFLQRSVKYLSGVVFPQLLLQVINDSHVHFFISFDQHNHLISIHFLQTRFLHFHPSADIRCFQKIVP